MGSVGICFKLQATSELVEEKESKCYECYDSKRLFKTDFLQIWTMYVLTIRKMESRKELLRVKFKGLEILISTGSEKPVLCIFDHKEEERQN